LNPQFWAEDGTIFFIQQYNYGISAIFQQYAGYFHFAPRIIALLADWFFPYSVIPWVYNYSSLFVTLLVISSIFSPRLIIKNKTLLALSIVTIPHFTNEVFLNITNLQWILSLFLVVVLLKELPQSFLDLLSDLSMLLISGFTGPFIIFLTPFFIFKFFRNREFYSFIILSLVLIISCVQLYSIIVNPTVDMILEKDRVAFDANNYIDLFAYRVFGNLFFGIRIGYKINSYFLFMLFLFFIAFIFHSSCHKKVKLYTVYFMIFALLILIATFYKFKSNPTILIPAGNATRYFYIPNLMITWSLIINIEQNFFKSTLISLLLIIILLSSLSSEFHSKPLVNYNWKSYSQKIGKEDNLEIPINPSSWRIMVKKNR
jgi:hypothetical protein